MNDVILGYQYYYYSKICSRMQFFGGVQASRNSQPEVLPEAEIQAAEVYQGLSNIHIRSVNADPKESRGREVTSSPMFSHTLDANKPSMSQAVAGVLANAALANAMGSEGSITSVSTINTSRDFLAALLAWSCTFVYVGSRIPQLVENRRRQSVEGISPLLFSSALIGNLTYTLSILTSCEFLLSPNRAAFFFRELPYMLGSSGTVVFDLIYFYQRYKYRKPNYLALEMSLQPWDHS